MERGTAGPNRLGHGAEPFAEERLDIVPGIVIAHGGWAAHAPAITPGLRAFVYGESLPASPTLPFGRWKNAS